MIAGIVLAAGASRRLGHPKQLLPFGGETLLGHVLAQATATLDRVIVVLGASSSDILAHVDLHGATPIQNPTHQAGQATSLLTGLRGVAAWPDAEAALVLLGDQPLAHPEVITRLIATLRQTAAATVVPRYGERLGNPVLFARRAWPLLQTLSGDTGARHLLARGEPAPLVEVDLPAAWWPHDIDTWADYQASVQARTSPGAADHLDDPAAS